MPEPWRVRRSVLLAFAASVAVSASACSGGGDEGVDVHFVLPTPTPAGLPGLPTPKPVPPDIIISSEEVFQAGAALISVTGGPVQAGTITFLGRTVTLSQGARSMYAFVPVGIEDPPGPHELKIEFQLPNGSKGTSIGSITVLKTTWTTDYVQFKDDQQSLLDPKVAEQENTALAAIYSTVTPQKLWDAAWVLPVNGAVTARFGEQRSVNGGPPAGHHGGTDFGANEGTAVTAPNAGRVVMARRLQLRGNMIIIDHGGGLLSGYAHLKEFAVVEGQEVKTGELIGYVGNTGLSTGAHLHWEIAVNGMLVDAIRFTDGSNGF